MGLSRYIKKKKEKEKKKLGKKRCMWHWVLHVAILHSCYSLLCVQGLLSLFQPSIWVFFFWGSGALLMTKKNGIFYACLVSSKKGESMFWCFLNIHMEYSISLCFG